MRNPPRLFKVPLAVLISIVPFTGSAFVGPAGADTASDCEAAFSSPVAAGLTYATDPPTRLAWTGQTVSLSAGWDPSAWDSLSSAEACVRVNDVGDDVLGTAQTAPVNEGSFDHSFTVPEVDQGSRLCTRIRLAGDPAGEATEAVWVSKEHCFEVDHEVEEETPPDTTPAPPPPSTTTTSAPVAAPAGSSSIPGSDTPPVEGPEAAAPATPQGAPDAPFDSAGSPSPDLGSPQGPPATSPESAPMLPATGYASMSLLQKGELSLFSGLALLVLFGLPRRRPGRPQA
jgi:hypothetical protein